jgi:uncharacterized protein YjcR
MVDISKETKIDRLWSLSNTLKQQYMDLLAHINQAVALESVDNERTADSYYNLALKNLRGIEDRIKRFNENRPQEYEE